ncbi:unnamed protein product [Symbiodinium sp. CCMP2592]|nr:unnamed protein product [Symbiodinium sp. CCMP2592]
MLKQLQSFDIRSAKCSVEEDRTLLEAIVARVYDGIDDAPISVVFSADENITSYPDFAECLQIFNEQVRGPLFSELRRDLGEGSGGRADGRDRDRVSSAQCGLLRHGLALWAGSLRTPVSPHGSWERPSDDHPDKTAVLTMVCRVWCHRALARFRQNPSKTNIAMDDPEGIAVHHSTVFVSDTVNHRIIMVPILEYETLGCFEVANYLGCYDTRDRENYGFRKKHWASSLDDVMFKCSMFRYVVLECPSEARAVFWCTNQLFPETMKLEHENCYGDPRSAKKLNGGSNGLCSGGLSWKALSHLEVEKRDWQVHFGPLENEDGVAQAIANRAQRPSGATGHMGERLGQMRLFAQLWQKLSLGSCSNDDGFKAVLLEQGAHPEAPPGAEEDRARQDRAASVAHLRPLKAGATLRADKEDARPMPPTKEIKKARRSFIDSQAPKTHRDDDQVSVWIEYVKEQSQASSTKEKFELKFTVAKVDNGTDPLFSLLRDCVVPSGSCVLISDTMLACIRRVLKTGKQGSGLTLVTDFTYKLNRARGIDLLSVVRYVLMDGATAGRNATAKEDAVAIRSVVFFTAPLPTIRLFHACWQTTLHDFEQKGKAKTLKYLKEHILEASDDGEFWASGWASGLWNAPPGHGPQTCQQSLERYNRTIKQTMPAGYHLLSLPDMVKSLDSCNRTIMVDRGHVDGQDERRVLFQPTDPSVPCQKLLAADWVRPGRDEIGEQVCLAPVQRVYVMPLKQYNLSIDSDCHRKFVALLTADDAASYRAAASDLNLLKDGRLSLPRLRVRFGALAMTLKLQRRFHGHVIVCTCSYFSMHGTCVHHLLTRWMERDPAVRLADVSEFTAKPVSPTPEGAEEALRQRLLPRGQDSTAVFSNNSLQ